VYTHSVWAAPGLYRDDVDRLEFPRHLARVTRSIGWKCVAYCLMKTHHHLIVRVDDDVLPRAMHRLNLAYARQHNRRHGLRGHVQFERYGSRRLHNGSYAGTVGATGLGSFVDPTELIRAFDGRGIDPRVALRTFVEAA
jgi:REP element-mobilizing transposase RayT